MSAMKMQRINQDDGLRDLIAKIADGDLSSISGTLARLPLLARAQFEITDATRQTAKAHFLPSFERYIYKGDTALHFAAAAFHPEIAQMLLAAGADVGARNRLGDQALHSAAAGNPLSRRWNPVSQAATIAALIEAGADPNAINRLGVAPLHKAVRTRCAAAVHALLARGADPKKRNRSGSTPLLLASLNTGRGGSGSPQAKAQQEEILRLLEEAAGGF